VREELIERNLIAEAFKARGGQIPDQYVNDEIKRMIKSRFKGDKALFEQVLTEQKKTRAEYMEIIREQMAVGMLMNEEVSQRVKITPKQIRDEYDSNLEKFAIPEKIKYSIIVLNKGVTSDDKRVKKEEAESIRKRIVDGENFNEVAKEVSEGSRAKEGGAFPWMQPKDIRPVLQEALKNLAVGEVSPIITTDSELCLLKVDARRQAGYKPFDEVRLSIKSALQSKERARLKKNWIKRLKQTNYVVLYD
jgi:peptidyl-prolyl cis-trans isomerase SurA